MTRWCYVFNIINTFEMMTSHGIRKGTAGEARPLSLVYYKSRECLSQSEFTQVPSRQSTRSLLFAFETQIMVSLPSPSQRNLVTAGNHAWWLRCAKATGSTGWNGGRSWRWRQPSKAQHMVGTRIELKWPNYTSVQRSFGERLLKQWEMCLWRPCASGICRGCRASRP